MVDLNFSITWFSEKYRYDGGFCYTHENADMNTSSDEVTDLARAKPKLLLVLYTYGSRMQNYQVDNCAYLMQSEVQKCAAETLLISVTIYRYITQILHVIYEHSFCSK